MSATAQLLSQIGNWLDTIGKKQLRRWRQAQARQAQHRFVKHYIAVTGSCGKTTTTVLTGSMLEAYGRSVTGRHNVGVTLLRTVRKLRGPVDFVVQETSGHGPGAISLTTDALRVDTAVVTSIGFDHGAAYRNLGLDIPDAIAQEKGKLVEAVAPGGFACLNFDDPRVRAMATRTQERIVSFGVAPDALVRATDVEARWPQRLAFNLLVAGRVYPVTTRFVGTMMLTNILGALAVVHGFGLPLEPAIARLATREPVPDRMGVQVGGDGKTYIVDTEKAPMWSVELLIEELSRMAIPNLTFVLGDVSDIRSNSGQQYRKLARLLSARVETLVLAGRSAELGAKVMKEDGFDNIVLAPTAVDVSKYLDAQAPGIVFLKSNKSLQLWRVLDQVAPLDEPSHA